MGTIALSMNTGDSKYYSQFSRYTNSETNKRPKMTDRNKAYDHSRTLVNSRPRFSYTLNIRLYKQLLMLSRCCLCSQLIGSRVHHDSNSTDMQSSWSKISEVKRDQWVSVNERSISL